MIKNIILLTTILFSHFTFASIISGDGEIIKVIDGDTFDVRAYRSSDIKSLLDSRYVDSKHVNGNVFRVRLSNINTEESKHLDSNRNTAFGQETSKVVKRTFSNKEVTFRCYDRGYYGRAVCSLNTGKTDIGHWLISNNYSPYITKYGQHPEYNRLYSIANKKSKRPTTFTVNTERHSHRDNTFHNIKKQEFQQKSSKSAYPILETTPEALRGNLLDRFKNRNNRTFHGTGNLSLFENRLGNNN